MSNVLKNQPNVGTYTVPYMDGMVWVRDLKQQLNVNFSRSNDSKGSLEKGP